MLAVAALLVAAGIAVVVYGIAERRRDRMAIIEEIIETEAGQPGTSPEALTELMEKAGAFAERAIGHTSIPERVRVTLTQAGWSLRPGEFVAVLAASGLGAGFLGGLFFGSVAASLFAAAATPVALVAGVKTKGRRRVRRIEAQLPTVLQILAGSLESGASILHSMELVAEEGDPPLSTEFARVVAETRVGRPLLESLEAMAERVGSRDVEWTVEAIRIQHTAGGKLADTLRVLAEFMRTRLEVRGEVRALSAEARLSGKVLTGLPFALGGYLLLIRPKYLEPLYQTGIGRGMLVAAACGVLVGTVWMRRIVRVEV
jgi:tight adherence protein B